MRVLRSFLPVGQGAFFREAFYDGKNRHNIVYDCGSSTDIEIVKTTIRNEFDKGETIDALFISHFDDDHINGIPFLLEYCNVRQIFIPYLSKRDLLINQLFGLASYGEKGTVFNFLHNPYVFLDEHCLDQRPRLFQIRDNDFSENDVNGIDAVSLPSGNDVSQRISNDIVWEYIPFNFRNRERSKIFFEELKRILSDDLFAMDEINRNNIVDFYKSYKKQIISAMRVVPGDFNTNSMCLFSGIQNKRSLQRALWPHSRMCYYHSAPKPIGCLYTGDYDASGAQKWVELRKAYSTYWDYIGCLQVPHHGSKYNYNHEFALIDAYFIISAGLNNKYRHPHSAVVKDLLLNGRNLCWVSELRNSQVDLICMP